MSSSFQRSDDLKDPGGVAGNDSPGKIPPSAPVPAGSGKDADKAVHERIDGFAYWQHPACFCQENGCQPESLLGVRVVARDDMEGYNPDCCVCGEPVFGTSEGATRQAPGTREAQAGEAHRSHGEAALLDGEEALPDLSRRVAPCGVLDVLPEPHRELVRLYNEGLQTLRDALDLGLSDLDEADTKIQGLILLGYAWRDLIESRRRETAEPSPATGPDTSWVR